MNGQQWCPMIGVRAYDLMSRNAMMEGFFEGWREGDQILPPRRRICGKMEWPTHKTSHREGGGEQRDAFMPLLFSLGLLGALAVQARFWCE